jgi:pimeloyl-ACP methyl ester carboxylesterase
MTEWVRAGDVDIAYETFGTPADPPLLLIMGLGVQMLGWREPLCESLADEGLFVIRFDNRDVGCSTHFDDGPQPDLFALMGGDGSSAPYRLEDMAHDALGLLTGLGIESAHVVGASMGGYIAQTLAIKAPERVRSLTSIMSTPSVAIGEPTDEAKAVLLTPPTNSREDAAERAVAVMRVIGSPAYPFDEVEVAESARRAYDRDPDPRGALRQLAAIIASGDRTEALRALRMPALVIHGEADPLVGVAGGRATAEAIPGARLLTIPGMGHDLPRALWPRLVEAVASLARRADAAGARA